MRKDFTFITCLIVIMFLKGVLWAIAFPLWQGPDEDDHYAVIQFIAETGRLPDVGDEVLPDEVSLAIDVADVGRLDYHPDQRQAFSNTNFGLNESRFEEIKAQRASFEIGSVGKLMHATPLYYMFASIPYRWVADGTLLERAFSMRLLTLVMSLPLLPLTYAIVMFVRPNDKMLARTVTFLVAFHPMITHITSIVTVDGFFFVLYSLAILLGLLIYRDGFTRKWAVLLGIVFAVGVLVKPTMNGFAPLIVLVVLTDFIRVPKRRKEIVWNGLLSAVIVAIPVGWWMQRSLRINQDLFYFNPVLKGHRIIIGPLYDYPFWQHVGDYYQSVIGGVFVTWWAYFGWLDTPVANWVYDLLRWLTFFAIVGLVVLVWKSGKKDFWRAKFPYIYFALIILFPILLIQYYDYSFWHTYGVGRGLQGRYWLGTVIPMLLLWVVGLRALTPNKWHSWLDMSLRLGMVLFNFIALLGYILPRYYL